MGNPINDDEIVDTDHGTDDLGGSKKRRDCASLQL
jgi:hypothetical protein